MGRVVSLLFLVLAFQFVTECQAQDRLVTTAGDTVYCKIESIEGNYLVFTQDGNSTDRKKIAFEVIASYTRDYKTQELIVLEPVASESYVTRKQFVRRNVRKGFMLGLGAAYSHRLAPVPSNMPEELQDYIRKLKSGFAIKVDGNYFFGRFFGLGVKYSFAHARNKMQDVYFQLPNGSITSGDISDKIDIHTVGFHLTSRVGPRSGKFNFLPGVSAGYSAYINNAVALDPIKITSGTFSLGIHLAVDFSITERLHMGLGVDYMSGLLNYVNVETQGVSERFDLEGDSRDSLARLELWGGFRYYFKPITSLKKHVYE